MEYENKDFDVYAPFGGRKLDEIHVNKVINGNVLQCHSLAFDYDTAYYLSDGITLVERDTETDGTIYDKSDTKE